MKFDWLYRIVIFAIEMFITSLSLSKYISRKQIKNSHYTNLTLIVLNVFRENNFIIFNFHPIVRCSVFLILRDGVVHIMFACGSWETAICVVWLVWQMAASHVRHTGRANFIYTSIRYLSFLVSFSIYFTVLPKSYLIRELP